MCKILNLLLLLLLLLSVLALLLILVLFSLTISANEDEAFICSAVSATFDDYCVCC